MTMLPPYIAIVNKLFSFFKFPRTVFVPFLHGHRHVMSIFAVMVLFTIITEGLVNVFENIQWYLALPR
jgi:hypothetical protein